MKNALTQFILENAQVSDVQQAVKECNMTPVAYKIKRQIHAAFPEITKGLQFGLAVSEAMSEYKTESIIAADLLVKINALVRKINLLGKWHSDHEALCLEHDALVMLSNELQKPINLFLKDYKKAQSKKISIVQKRVYVAH